jgi:uncharacterized ParB-like nuclease family protein
MEQTLKLDQINIYGGTQTRAATIEEAVINYGDAMLKGIEFPPVTVFYDGKTYWLADGFHRYLATKSIDKKVIDTKITEGSRTEALIYALGANATNGLYRTNADKRASVEIALEEWPDYANTRIADLCKVSVEYARKIRKEVQKVAPEKVTGKDGKQYPSKVERLQRGETANGEGGGGRGKPPSKKGEMGILGGGISELEQAVKDYARGGDLDFIKAPSFEASGAAKIGAQVVILLKEISLSDENREGALKMVFDWVKQELQAIKNPDIDPESEGVALFVDLEEE